jgi:hypothetical protein
MWAIPLTGWTRIEWSKQGDSYFYFRRGQSANNPGIVEHMLDSGQERHVYRPELPEGYAAGYRGLKFSRDYRQLVLSESHYPVEERPDGDEGTSHLLVIDMDSGETRKLAPNQGLRGAGWSPDGKFVIAPGSPFVGGRRYGLHLVPVDGSPSQRLEWGEELPEETHFFSSIDWSPDGTRIVFSLRTVDFKNLIMKDVLAEKIP